MLDFPVSWPVITLAAAASVLLVVGFPRWNVRHRDASAPSCSRKRPVHHLPVHAALSPSAHFRLNISGEPLCLFYELLAGFACAWSIDFSCTQGVGWVSPDYGLSPALPLGNLPPFPHAAHRFAMVLHKL